MILDDGAGANQLTAEHGPLKTPLGWGSWEPVDNLTGESDVCTRDLLQEYDDD